MFETIVHGSLGCVRLSRLGLHLDQLGMTVPSVSPSGDQLNLGPVYTNAFSHISFLLGSDHKLNQLPLSHVVRPLTGTKSNRASFQQW